MYALFNFRRMNFRLTVSLGEDRLVFTLYDQWRGTMDQFILNPKGALSIVGSIEQSLLDDPSWAMSFTVHSPHPDCDRYVLGRFETKMDAKKSNKAFKTAVFTISHPFHNGEHSGYDQPTSFFIDLRRTEVLKLKEFLSDYYNHFIGA